MVDVDTGFLGAKAPLQLTQVEQAPQPPEKKG